MAGTYSISCETMTDRDSGRGVRGIADRRRFLQAIGAIGVAGMTGSASADNGDDNPWDDYEAPPEDETPERVAPGADPLGAGAEPPEDATTLWDGDTATLDNWENGSQWIEHDDYFEVDLGSGNISTEEAIGDCHLHLEWRSPKEYEGYVDIEEDGDGQAPGNSGVFLMQTYEVQILQSHDNPTYPSGYAGSYYRAAPGGGAVPLVMPINPPGEWNVYDIVWRGPRFDGDELTRYPQLTVFFNGVAIINHYDIPGPTFFEDLNDFADAHPQDEDGNFLEEVPIELQDHSGDIDECHFRNIWYRDLPESPVEIDSPDDMPEYDSDAGVWEDRDDWDGRFDSYDPDHPDQPEQIEPGDNSGAAPADADVLIDSEETLVPGEGGWESDDTYGDSQIHVEWQVDANTEAMGPWRGDSGLQIGRYELQILDTYENPVEAEEWAGAYTGEAPPIHDAVRESGECQSLDVVFQGPQDDGPAQVTAFLNGVIVQARLQADEPNADGDEGSIRLQEPVEDGSEVHFQNTWIRPLYN